MANSIPLVARILLSLLFILAGVGKIMDPAGTAQFIESASPLPGMLALPTGIFELGAGVLLASGRYLKYVSLALAGFTALATVLFHNQLGDQMQLTMALKNLAIIGGLLLVYERSASADPA
ncbi:MAG: DoxX family protein [Alphaproteobacteria bacterium]|nr:MAG: DoxX family protein [Alphaproteobacteria bacterium]